MFKKLHTIGLNRFHRALAVLLAVAAFCGMLTFSASAASFPDVKAGEWYYNAVNSAVEKGYFIGEDDGYFYPDGQITRAQFATVVARFCAADYENASGAPFEDVPVGEWYYGAISWAYNNGIINGVSEKRFKPEDKVTREQMCKMIGVALEQVLGKTLSAEGAKTFNDSDQISDYAKEWVAKCAAEGIINGYETGDFKPAGNASRAEAAKVLVGCYDRFIAELKDYDISVSGFELDFDIDDDYYLVNPADFTNCMITGYTGFKAIDVSVEQYASYYPYASKAYKIGEALELGYGRAKITVTATLQDNTTREYLICLTDPRAAENSYAKVRVSENVNLRKEPNTNSEIIDVLKNKTTVYYLGNVSDEWCKVQVMGSATVGYIHNDYLLWNWKATEMPAQYEAQINALKANHPNWTFSFVDTEMTYAQALEKYGADKSFYINPANYLNEYQIFAFLDIDTYNPDFWNDDGIKSIWIKEDTFTKNEAASIINSASKSIQMNPYYIACRMALESGYGGSFFARGSSVVKKVTIEDNVTVNGMFLKKGDYYEELDLGKTYYNFFGIGAYNSNTHWAILYAGNRGWDTKEKAIVEGANWIKDQYLDRGSVTPYFFRYASYKREFQNAHSYMTDMAAPWKEAGILINAYSDPNAAAHFIIPVYRELPA